MKFTTGSGDNFSRISARQAWIPLEKRKTILMMHEITVGCFNITVPIRFGLTKVDHRKNKGSWFRERTSSCTRICTNRNVGSRKGGTCTSLVGSSRGRLWGVTEIAEHRRGRSCAALTGIPCEAHKGASLLRPGGGAYCSRPGGGCSKTRGAVVCQDWNC